MAKPIKSRRVPWVALVLSFLAPGLGHLYCGRIVKALPLYLAWTLVLLCATIATLLQPSVTVLVLLLLLPPVCMVIAYLYAAMDAWKLAHQIGADYTLRDYNRIVLYGLLILVHNVYPIGLIAGVRGLVYEPFEIPVSSMTPTILKGDRILARKLFTKDNPDRGDLVVYHNPTPTPGTGARFVGRVVAVSNDWIEISGKRLLINGSELTRVRVPDEELKHLNNQVSGNVAYEQNSGRRYLVTYGTANAKAKAQEASKETISDGQFFVLGDNRDRSRDSRHFGTIDNSDIVGYVDYVYWPAETWSRFGLVDWLR